MTFVGPARPPRRWHHASTTLDDFAVVSFRVDPDRLRARVPERFEPTVRRFADGTDAALVSVVAFVERDFAFRFAPFVSISGPLVDYRAYGTLDGERGVYVFLTSLDHPMVTVPRVLWRMPWERERVQIDGSWDRPGPDRVRVSTDGERGLELDLVGTGGPVGALDGFADADEAIEVLTHPMAGWYGPAGDVRRYSVWHDVLQPQAAVVERACVPAFADLGLVGSSPAIHSALVVRTASFDIHTPPRRLR
jgi:hypothetical protein